MGISQFRDIINNIMMSEFVTFLRDEIVLAISLQDSKRLEGINITLDLILSAFESEKLKLPKQGLMVVVSLEDTVRDYFMGAQSKSTIPTKDEISAAFEE